MTDLNTDALAAFVAGNAAIRRRQTLQPVGGQGDKIFPPTYPGETRNSPPRHVFERRRINGDDVWCVLIDSVQSQANRLEECLLSALRTDKVFVPHVVVDFEDKVEGISSITSLEAPHRIFDAILRDSLLDGVPFMQSDLGRQLAKATLADASAIMEVSPTALLFGAWHSTGEGGGLGAKFARCLVSEIVGVDVPVEGNLDERTGEFRAQTAGRRTGSRIDPLGVLRKVEVFKGSDGWDLTQQGAGRGAKKVRPSEINHGNIAPSVVPLGVTCSHLQHTFVLSFAALRRLSFGSAAKDAAGRAMLAALGLLAALEQDARGYALRSRCELVCDGRDPLELVRPDGSVEEVTLSLETGRRLYNDAFDRARSAGFSFPHEPIRLTPQDKLVEIVRRSQELALSGEGGEGEEGA